MADTSTSLPTDKTVEAISNSKVTPQRVSSESTRASADDVSKEGATDVVAPPPEQPVDAAVPTPAALPESEYLSTRKFIPVFISIYLSILLIALDRLIVSVAVPQITDEFHSLGDIGWYASAYMLTASAFMLIFGRLYGFYSPKWVFLICILIFEIGSAVCGSAPNSVAFIWGRAIAGLGGAGSFSGAIVIVMFTVPMHKRPMYSGLLGSAFGIASTFGPIVGGAFTSSSATWRWCFYLNLPIGGAAMVIIFFLLPTIPTPNRGGSKTAKEQLLNLDPIGTVLFLPSMVCLILALQWGGSEYAWNDGRIIALLVVFAVTFVSFIGVQWWKGERATVPPRIFFYRSVYSAMMYTFCTGGGMMVIVYFLPIWFQAIEGVSALESGIRTIPLVLAISLFSILSGIAVRKLGYFVPMMFVLVVLASIGAGVLTTFTPSTSEGMWIGIQVLYGAGLGIGMQQGSIAVQTTLTKKDISIGASLVLFAQQLGGALFIPVAQNVFNQKLVSGLGGLAGVDASEIVDTGATDLRDIVPVAQLPEVLEIYNGAITTAFKVGLALTCASIIGASTMEWRSVKAEQQASAKAKADQEAKLGQETGQETKQA